MPVDKFGHYYRQKYNTELIKKDVSKTLGIFIDENNNLDIQNKKIRNLASPAEDTDAVNKKYIHTQINYLQENIRKDVYQEFAAVANKLKDMNKLILELFKVINDIKNTKR